MQGCLGFAPGKPQEAEVDSRSQIGIKPRTDACSIEAESGPNRHSGCWEVIETHSTRR